MVKTATISDLYRVDGKAELLDGRIVEMSPTGFLPGYAASQVLISLDAYAKKHRTGYAVGDNVAYRVDLPHRKSFSPDASFHKGTHSGMKFLEDAPWFAVEVRSENDYTKKAERQIEAKIRDYLGAGTRVVWDVDVLSNEVIRMYRADSKHPLVFARGGIAHAEPALPAWTIEVESLFPYYVPYVPEDE